MKKKVLSGLLALALVFGSAAALPEGLFDEISTASVSALTEEKFDYVLSADGTYAILTKFNDTSTDTCWFPETLGGKPVEVIAEGAFENNTKLVYIVGDTSSLRIIGNNAFKGCSSLKQLYLRNAIEYINDSAFEGCSELRSISDLPQGLKAISANAFKDCTSITSITIPGSVGTVGVNAFSGCTSLKSLTIQNGVKNLGVGAFEKCSSLQRIAIPDSIKSIPVKTFNKCTNLTEATIPDSVTSIGAWAFTECENLKRILVPSSVKDIGKDNTSSPITEDNPVFDLGCTIMCTPGSAAQIHAVFKGNKIEYYDGDFVYKELKDGTVEITEYIGEDTTITIPSKLSGNKVSRIGAKAFKNCFSLESVTIQDGVTVIDHEAFDFCNRLKSITIPDSVTYIGYDAFCFCKSLESLTIPDSVTVIGNTAFRYCESLKSLTLPNNDTNYGTGVFLGCKSLEKAVFPKDADAVYGSMYAECDGLTSVTIPNGVKTIRNSAFGTCRGITSITIPSSVKYIWSSAFAGCHKLSDLTIPSGVVEIDENAFADCKSLKSVTISKTVTEIGEKAFGYVYDANYNWVKDDDFVIKCYKDTRAEKYAKENGFKIEYLGVTHVKAKEPTCTTAGNIEYWKYDNKYYTDKGLTKQIDESKIVIKATGHKYGEPTWTWTGTTAATAKFVCANDSSHVETVKATITSKTTKATCEKDGKTVYTATATLDGKTYTKTKTVTIDKLGHSWGEPTWTWSGTTAATAKFVCANDSSHVETVKATITSKTTKATCEKDGKTVYTATATLDGKTYTKTKTVTIDKLGHKWGEPTWTWDGVKAATAKFVCGNNSKHVKTFDATITSKTTKATCEKDGKTVYTATVTFGGKTYTDTKTVTIKKTGHKYGEPTWTWTGTTSATAKFVCANDKSHVETVKATITSKTTKATCEKDGKTVYTATATFGGKTYTDTKTVTIAKTGHKFSAWKTTAYDFKKNTSTQQRTCSVCKTTETRTVENAITRLKGSGRYATAAAISKGAYSDTASTVILANGNKYADALAGATLAKAYGAPILLTEADTLPAETLAEIKRLKAKKVIILGGSGSVGAEVKKALTDNGLDYTIVKGSSRFATAVEIANKTKEKMKKDPTEIFFVSSDKFADALSVSSIAALKKAPIIYLPKSGAIDDVTAAYLKTMKGKIKNAYVIGGSGVIGADVMAAAGKALGLTVDKTIVRVKGSTKYDTCVEVNKKFASVLKGTAICVATGEDFPDALAGGVFAAQKSAPLFLANGSLSDTQKAYLKSKNADSIYVLGGSKSVPDTLVQNIAKASV